MAFSFLTTDNVFTRYKDSKKYTDSLTEPFPEYDRVSQNKPKADIPKQYPKTTDGTTASIIRKVPRRVLQQLPTGVVEADEENEWLGVVAGFIYQDKILKYANQDYDLIQKGWNVIEQSLGKGGCPSYAPFIDHDGYFCPDMTIPHWGDIFLQKGKKSFYACNYAFLRTWWQKEDIEALIDKQTKNKKKNKDAEQTWDVENLRSILDKVVQKEEKAQAQHERGNGKDVSSGIEIVTGFQKGVGAKFYTFSPSEELILRTKVNKDPRGKMPIDWMYGDTDGSNPWGRSIIELVGPLQNLIDADMQMYQFNRALSLAPPVIKKGTFPKSRIVWAPNWIIDVGNDPQAKVEALTIDSTAIAQYPALYGLQKSQLLNLVASPDTSISAEIGNPGFSKTPEGVKTQNAIVSVDDNYVRKMFETWFENWSETAINLFFGERSGIEEVQLDKETIEKLQKLAQEGKFDPQLLSPDGKIRIDYDTDTPALKFRVDASTSKMQDDAKQQQGLVGLLQALDQSPVLAQTIPPEKVLAIWNSMVAASGIENPEDAKVDLEQFKQEQEQKMAMAQQQMQAQQAQQAQQPQMPPQDPTQGTQFSPEDQQFIQQLKQMGIPDDQIGRALAMLHTGHGEQEILAMLGVGNG